MTCLLLKWCRGRDSNPHGLLHTPLKRARLPITPPRLGNKKNYLLAGGAAFAASEAASVAGVSIRAPVFAFVLAEFASAFEFETAGGSAGAAGASASLLSSTDTLPLKAGIDIIKADNIKIVAAAIVTFESTEAVPRGPNAELEMLLVNNAPASVLPG